MTTHKGSSRFYEEFDHQCCIGQGAFGKVYRVRHKLLKKHFAVKKVALPKSGDKDRVLRESKALAILEHPNIVRFYNVWVEYRSNRDREMSRVNVLRSRFECQPEFKTYLYVQMELCEGGNLEYKLSKNMTLVCGYDAVMFFFKQLISAVDYIHQHNMIHRDIKPQNILFSGNKIKLGDFGLVTVSESSISNRGELKNRSICGTRVYMSPEQIAGRAYNNKVDIYACGLVLCELLAGGSRSERYRMLEGVKEGSFPRRLVEKYPKDCRVVKSMLAKNPNDRLSARSVMKMLSRT